MTTVSGPEITTGTPGPEVPPPTDNGTAAKAPGMSEAYKFDILETSK